MAALKKIMNDEIKKYQGRIYYLDMRENDYACHNVSPSCSTQGGFTPACATNLKPCIRPAEWIVDTSCYDHSSFELHHVIKFTHFEKNKNWYKEQGLNMCLILLPKVLHQHLENPVYELPDDIFFNKYGVRKYELLFIKKEYEQGNYPTILKKGSSIISFDDIDLSCFDALESEALCV